MDTATTRKVAASVREWYETYRRFIPSLESPAFATIAGSHNRIAESVTFGTNRKCTHGVDLNSDAAYYDSKTKRIMIPGTYLNRESILGFVNDPEADVEALSLALINGSQIHEALHAFHTPDDWASMFPAHFAPHRSIVQTLTNVVEDLFIEGTASYNPIAKMFLEAKNEVMFSAETIEKMTPEQATSDLESMLNLIIAFKNPSLRELITSKNANIGRILSNFVRTVRINAPEFQHKSGLSSTGRRTAAAKQLYEYLLPFIREFESNEEKSESGDAADGEKKSGLQKLVEKVDRTGAPSPLTEEEKEELETMAKAFESASKMSKARHSNVSTIFGAMPQMVEIDIMNTGFSRSRPLAPATGDYKFVSTIRQLKTHNHTHGEAMKAGSILVNTRISRIATDGKVFGRRETPVDANKIPEVVILVDASGSMSSNFAVVLSQAWSLFIELKKLGIPTAVYAHTSLPDGGNDHPTLYHIASYSMKTTTSNEDARFQVASSIDQNQNYDGYAIEWLDQNAFTQRIGAKLLFVLSDGRPSGEYSYVGDRAITHTMKAISNARKAGRMVVSFSLVSGVVAQNNAIYGSNMNIDSSVSFEAEFKKLFTRLQSEGRL